MSLGSLAAIVALVAANAFFVAVEFSLVASRPARLEQLAASGSRRAEAALAATARLSRQIAGVQLGVTMASLGLGLVGEPAAAEAVRGVLRHLGDPPKGLVDGLGFAVGLLLVTFAHTVFGELVPKSLAIADAEAAVLWLALPMRAFVWVFGPAITVLDGAARLVLRPLRIRPRDELVAAHTAEEITRLLEASRHEGLIEEYEAQLVSGAIGLRARTVASVLVPRDELVAVPLGATVASVEALVVSSGHSRLPVYAGDLDHIAGFVHAKDLLGLDPGDAERPLPRRLVRQLLVVSPSRPLDEVLATMRLTHRHVALAVDAGHVVGLVALEDVIEELVGEINDETDKG